MHLPHQAHILQHIHSEGQLGTFHNNHAYIVGFVKPNDCIYTSRHITKNAIVTIKDHESTSIKTIDTERGQVTLVYFDKPSLVHITKEQSPSFDFLIESWYTDKLFNMPMGRNLGLILAYKLYSETPEQLSYESYIIDPLYHITSFRRNLDI
jgi:hypothetical protein